MCLAIPGQVLEVKDDELVVQYPHENRTVGNAGLDVKPGDYVLVQAKMAMIKLKEDEAEKSLDAWEEAIERSGE